MVDRDGLENRCTLTGTEGSNPSLSAKTHDTETSHETAARFGYLMYFTVSSIIRLLAKPTGCIILSPPCACRCIVIASFGYAYRFTVMHMVRSIPCRCYLSEKKKRVDSACWTGCLCVCDGCAGYVSTPWAGKPDNQLYAIVKFLCEKEKPFRPSVEAVWKALDKYL